MNAKEIRMRCIEALSTGGIRDPQRIIRDAAVLVEWVSGAEEEKPSAPRGRPRNTDADKE